MIYEADFESGSLLQTPNPHLGVHAKHLITARNSGESLVIPLALAITEIAEWAHSFLASTNIFGSMSA